MNGFYNAENTDTFTCINTLGQSIIDNLICSQEMLQILRSFNINHKLIESDHTPLIFEFKSLTAHGTIRSEETMTFRGKNTVFKYKFDATKLKAYITKYNSEMAKCNLLKMSKNIEGNASTDTVAADIYTLRKKGAPKYQKWFLGLSQIQYRFRFFGAPEEMVLRKNPSQRSSRHHPWFSVKPLLEFFEAPFHL